MLVNITQTYYFPFEEAPRTALMATTACPKAFSNRGTHQFQTVPDSVPPENEERKHCL